MSERPFGSFDWNGNGEYDFFDQVTDKYVYDKVTNYKPEQPKSKPTPNIEQHYMGEREWGLWDVVGVIMAIVGVVGIISKLT